MPPTELAKFLGAKYIERYGVSTVLLIAAAFWCAPRIDRFIDLHFSTVEKLSDASVKSTEIQERQSRISANIEKIVGENRSVFTESANKISEIHRDVKDVKELVSRKEKPE